MDAPTNASLSGTQPGKPEPVRPRPGELQVVTLGGLGAIGMNCMVLEQGDDVLVIDCGVTFPARDIGVDVLHPRFEHLVERADRVRGVIITHGHEDHIGALPYLLDRMDVPVWGPAHSLSLIERRLEEHGIDVKRTRMRETKPREAFDVGSFQIEPIRVTHSIADATALAIRTIAGLVIHTGDFKIDPSPTDGEVTDEARLSELGDEGVRLLFSDSTNVDSRGWSGSESDVGDALEKEIASADHRVIVGLFASNVQRLSRLGAIAVRAGRKICLLGRSMQNHADTARSLGMLPWPSNLVVDVDVAQNMPRRDVLILATGTQAEARAALSRLALGTHPRMRIAAGDTLVLSSRVIPGNDREVVMMMGDFLRAGIHVVSRITHPGIHASGHAHRDEQLRMIELCRPRAFMPVHGTLHHLCRHAELAREAGVEEVIVVEDGDLVRVPTDGAPTRTGRIEVGQVAIWDGEEIDDAVLRDRATLARAGVLAVSVTVDRRGNPLGRARVSATGVVGPMEGDVLEMAARAVDRAMQSADERTRESDDALATSAKLAARRSVEAETSVRPTVLVHVMRV